MRYARATVASSRQSKCLVAYAGYQSKSQAPISGVRNMCHLLQPRVGGNISMKFVWMTGKSQHAEHGRAKFESHAEVHPFLCQCALTAFTVAGSDCRKPLHEHGSMHCRCSVATATAALVHPCTESHAQQASVASIYQPLVYLAGDALASSASSALRLLSCSSRRRASSTSTWRATCMKHQAHVAHQRRQGIVRAIHPVMNC